jgi:hypothetical protein
MAGHGGGSVERILENLRQYQLTKALGQVVCSIHYQHREYEPCPTCGAVI